jgi:hypothetical protein
MKRIALPLLLAGTLLAQVANAQSSSTPVIGYYKFDAPAGTSVWVSGFVTKKDFQGAMSSITGSSTINQTGASFSALDLHYVEILSGPNAGMILDIVSYNATSVTVDGDLGAGGLNLVGTETYCIRRHATLGSIFQNGAGVTEFEDLIAIQNSDGTQTSAYWDLTNWINSDSGAIADDVIVYPAQGMMLITTGARVVTFGGGAVSYIKNGPTKVPLYVAGVNYIGTINPLVNTATPTVIDSTTTANYGLLSLEPFSDLAVTYARDGSFASLKSYFSDGTNIFDIDSNPGDADTIFNGSAIEVVPAADSVITLPQSFTSN